MTHTIGLLLAAGAGRRMGTPKALVTGSGGISWVVAAARTLIAGGCTETVVVIGAAAEKVRPLLEAESVIIVEALDWDEGMASSLRAGLGAVAGSEADSALIHLVDLPDVGPDVVRRLAALSAPDVLARATYGHGPGHPVLIGREHWRAITDGAQGDSGAGAYLAQHRVVAVDCADLAAGHDIDT